MPASEGKSRRTRLPQCACPVVSHLPPHSGGGGGGEGEAGGAGVAATGAAAGAAADDDGEEEEEEEEEEEDDEEEDEEEEDDEEEEEEEAGLRAISFPCGLRAGRPVVSKTVPAVMDAGPAAYCFGGLMVRRLRFAPPLSPPPAAARFITISSCLLSETFVPLGIVLALNPPCWFDQKYHGRSHF